MKTIPRLVAVLAALVAVASAAVFAGAADNVQAVPQDEDDALVFAAADDVVLDFKTANRSAKDVRLAVAVGPFKAVPVKKDEAEKLKAKGETIVAYRVNRYNRIELLADATVKSGEAVLKAGTEGPAQINLGKVPPGFYMADVTLSQGGERLTSSKYPLAVFEDVFEDADYEPPSIPVGVYLRYMGYRRKDNPLFWKTYVHVIAHDLRKHNVNAVVACGGFRDGELEIYNSYGVAGISRGGSWLDHPGVIASFIGDEPKPGEKLERARKAYEELRKKTDQVITTCMIGEGMGLGGPGGPVNLWKVLKPKVRVFRWYGVKKHFYGVLHHIHYKGTLPFTSVLRVAEASSDTPWWIILPAFGGDQHEAYFQNPSPAQMRSMIHLSLAYGADGLIFFQYQTGLVDAVTLKPRDGKLEAVGEVAGKVKAHADLFKTLEHVGLDIRCPSPVVQAVPVKVGVGEEAKTSVYAVNKDPVNSVSTRLLLWEEVWNWTSARDVFADKDIPVSPRDEEGYLSIPLTLGPGEGKLIVTNAAVKPKKK